METHQDRQIEPGDAEEDGGGGPMDQRAGKDDAAEQRRSPVDAPDDRAQPRDDHQGERRLDHQTPMFRRSERLPMSPVYARRHPIRGRLSVKGNLQAASRNGCSVLAGPD